MEELKEQLALIINKALKEKTNEAAKKKGILITHRYVWEKAKVSESTFYEALKGNCGVESLLKIMKALDLDLI